jgi:hypothetical protein
MRAFFYQVRALPGTEQTYLLERVDSDGTRLALPYAQDDVNWLALLSRQKSFRFLGYQGSFSALQESRRNTDGTARADKTYWSAYRKAHRVQAKKYLGHDLTTGALEIMALALEKHLKTKLGLADENPLQTTRAFASKDAQREKMAYLLDQNEKKDRLIADLKQELEKRDQMIAQLQKQQNRQEQQSKPQGKRGKPHPKRS